MPAFQFYETTILITQGERDATFSVISAPRELVRTTGRGRRRSPYADLLDDAADRASVPLPLMPLALAYLGANGETTGEVAFYGYQNLRNMLTDEGVWARPDDAALIEWPRPEYPEEFLGIALQAAALPLVPVEASPLEKRTLVEIGGSATLGFFTGGPVLMILAPIGLVAVRGLATVSAAFWEGAKPEVRKFGGDTTAWALDSLRRRLGIERRDEGDSD